MMRARYFGAALGAAMAAGLLIACTLTQSLDYLQNGGGTGAPDVVSEDPIVPDGGTEGGTKTGEVLVPDQTKPSLLAQDTTSLFWVSGGALMSVPKAGGAPKMHGSFIAPKYVAADPDPQGAIFVAAGTDVWNVPKAGGDGGIVYSGAAGSPAVETVKADESSLFVLQYDVNAEFAQLRRMAKDGGARVDVDVDGGGAQSLMTIDTQTLFWMDSSLSPTTFYEISKTAPAGTAAKMFPLLEDEEYPDLEFAVDADNLYWTTEDATTAGSVIVSRKREVGALPVKVLRGGPEDKFGPLAVDATDIYVIEYKAGSVLRVSKKGGASTVVVGGLQFPTSLVVDDTHVYVSTEGTGSMGMIVKAKK